MTTIFTSAAAITNPLPGTPRVLFPGAVITSDSLIGTGTLDGRKTDRFAGGEAMTWVGDVAKFTLDNAGADFGNSTTGYRLGVEGFNMADVEVSVRPTALQLANFGYIDVRRQGGVTGSGDVYRLRYTAADTVPGSARIINAANSFLSDAVPFVAGDRLGLRAKGTKLSILVNEVVVLTITDASVQAAGAISLAGANAQAGLILRDFIMKAA